MRIEVKVIFENPEETVENTTTDEFLDIANLLNNIAPTELEIIDSEGSTILSKE